MSSDKMSDIFAEASAAIQAETPEPIAQVESSPSVHAEPDFEVPSYLDTVNQIDSNDVSAPEETLSVPEVHESRIKYKADGQEFEATPEEARKALELARGARRAFSDRAKLKRQIDELKKSQEQSAEFRQKWEQVLADGAEPSKVWEKLTGQSWNQAVDSELRRRQMYAQATPEERKAIDLEKELANMRKTVEKVQSETSKKYEDSEKKAFEARTKYFQSMAEPVFEAHAEKFDSLAPAAANKLKKMLWLTSIRDLQDAKRQGIEPTRKVINKIFAENAQAIAYGEGQKVQEKVRQEIESKSQKATASAQIASQKNYDGGTEQLSDLVGMDPLKLFNRMIGKKS